MNINNRYKGYMAIAITRYKGDYALKMADSIAALLVMLHKEESLIGKEGHNLIFIYKGVNTSPIPVLLSTIEELRRGNQVDLENLLS